MKNTARSKCCDAPASVNVRDGGMFCTKCVKDCEVAAPVVVATRIRPRSEKRMQETQVSVFLKIWGERPHECVVCGVRLEAMRSEYFSHLLPKGTYPEYRNRPDNIVLKCAEHHSQWHREPKGILLAIPEWKPIVEQYLSLQRKANKADHEQV